MDDDAASWVATVATDLRTPLAAADLYLRSMLRRDELAPRTREKATQAQAHVAHVTRRVNRLVDAMKLLVCGRNRHEALEQASFGAIRAELDKLVTEQATGRSGRKPHDIQIDDEINDDPCLDIELEDAMAAIFEVVDNAVKFSDSSVPVRIVGSRAQSAIHLGVSNAGKPLTESDVERCLKPGWHPELRPYGYYWGWGNGSLGLWMASTLLAARGGSVVCTPTDEHGITRVTLVFPLAVEGKDQAGSAG